MQEQLAIYLSQNDPLAPYEQPWEKLPEGERERYRVYAYAAINFYRDNVSPPPVMPRWWEKEAS